MRRFTFILLGAAALLYGILLPRFYVGYFNDDAAYILAAKSLLQGRYVQFYNPAQPLTYFMPGVPLALTPWVALFAPHWAWLKLFSLLATLCSGFLLWKLSEHWLEPRWRLALAALWALNPLTIGLSGTVLAEPFFTTLCLGVFYLLKRNRQKPQEEGAMMLLAGWAAITRPHGFLLILSVTVALAATHRGRQAVRFAASAILPLAAFALRNYWITRHVSGYMADWQKILSTLSDSEGLQVLTNHALNVIQVTLLQNVFPAFWNTFLRAPGVWNAIASLLLIVCIGAGARTLLQKKWKDPAVLALSVFTLSYGGVQFVWLAADARFCVPIVSYLFLFMMLGLRSLTQRIGRNEGLWVVGALFLSGYGIAWGFAVRQTYWEPGDHHAPQHTFEWINRNIPAGSPLVSTSASAYSLYTNRRVIHRPPPGDAQEMRFWMLHDHVPYLVIQPMRLLNLQSSSQDSPTQQWLHAADEAARHPSDFKPIYEETEEQVRIYQAVDSPVFMQAYTLLREAQTLAVQGDRVQARKKAEQAAALEPGLQKARALLSFLNS